MAIAVHKYLYAQFEHPSFKTVTVHKGHTHIQTLSFIYIIIYIYSYLFVFQRFILRSKDLKTLDVPRGPKDHIRQETEFHIHI